MYALPPLNQKRLLMHLLKRREARDNLEAIIIYKERDYMF